MKKLLAVILSFVFFISLFNYSFFAVASDEINGNFTYFSNINSSNASYSFTYTDSYFDNGTMYNHDLAKMSLRLSMAAADTESNNIKDLFDSLKIDYSEESIHYPNPDFDYDAGTTTIGYAIGSKMIEVNNQLNKLIVVAVRGGGYGKEWASNFEMGKSNVHAGFDKASSQVLDGIKTYLDQNCSPEVPVKIWITGFSRGAAVANVTTHKLNKMLLDDKYSMLSYTNIFSYTFESPCTVTTKAFDYNVDCNIFNLINKEDLVTHIPPADWDYTRYGIDICLPSKELSENFDEYSIRQNTELLKILKASSPALTDEELNNTLMQYTNRVDNQVSFNEDFITELMGTFQNQKYYATNCEKQMCQFILEVFGGESIDYFAILLKNPFPNTTSFLLTNLLNLLTVVNSHYPELELAWMDALTEDDLIIGAVQPLYGDADGNYLIDLKDVLLTRKYMMDNTHSIVFINADTNDDKIIDMKDVLAIRKYLVME